MKKYSFPLFISVLIVLVIQVYSCKQFRRPQEIYTYQGEYICISLSRFLEELNRIVESGASVSREMDSLYGMSWLEGYVMDAVNEDIILVGKCLRSRPSYHAEDIFVNIQNVLDSVSPPYCSLDPDPANLLKLDQISYQNNSDNFEKKIEEYGQALGGQKIVIRGVPLNSRHAKIMIYADYDMKKISQGLLKAEGIPSCLDLSVADSGNINKVNSSMSRFWLHIKENTDRNTYPNFSYNEGIVFINECPVVVLTEKQFIDQEGKLQDNLTEDDKIAGVFSAEMSEKYDTLALQNSLFAELENLFRLQACLKAMVFNNDISIMGVALKSARRLHLNPGDELPDALPGLVNYRILEKETEFEDHREILTRIFLVAGGVDQNLIVDDTNLTLMNSLSEISTIITESRPELEEVYWTVNIPLQRQGFFLFSKDRS